MREIKDNLPTLVRGMYENYVFRKNGNLLIAFAKSNNVPNRDTEESKKKLGILVTAWPSHTLFFFSIALSVLLCKLDVEPILIFDDLTENIIPGKIKSSTNFIRKIKRYLNNIPVHFLSKGSSEVLDGADKIQIAKLAELNAYYKLKTTVPCSDTEAIIDYYRKDFENIAPLVKGVFNTYEFSSFIIPGGVYGHSGLYLHFGNKKNIRVSSYDSGPGEILVGTDNVAGYLHDIPKIMQNMFDNRNLSIAIEMARNEFENRLNRKDPRKFQKISYKEDRLKEKYHILFPLNIEIDTASLIQKSNFRNMYFWLKETLEYLLQNTDATIAIKDHPSIYNKSNSLKNAILDLFGNNHRVKFYDRNQQINTYRLIKNSRIVLPYTSTVGIEALLLGKTVIVENNVYYRNLRGIIKSDSKSDYFKKISKFLHVENTATDENKNEAFTLYYFTQKCNFLKTYFNPTHVDYHKWIHKNVDELLSNKQILILLKSFTEGKPLAELVSREQFDSMS